MHDMNICLIIEANLANGTHCNSYKNGNRHSAQRATRDFPFHLLFSAMSLRVMCLAGNKGNAAFVFGSFLVVKFEMRVYDPIQKSQRIFILQAFYVEFECLSTLWFSKLKGITYSSLRIIFCFACWLCPYEIGLGHWGT